MVDKVSWRCASESVTWAITVVWQFTWPKESRRSILSLLPLCRESAIYFRVTAMISDLDLTVSGICKI